MRQMPALLLAAAAVALLSGCGWFGRGTITISGTLEQQAPTTVARGGSRGLGSAVTHVAGVRIAGSDLESLEIDTVEAEVAEDGSFEIGLVADSDRILLLVDHDAQHRHYSVVGYIVIADGEQELVLFPTEYMVEDLPLGLVELTGTQAVSEITLGSAITAYELGADDLRDLARFDNAFVSIANHYRNYNEATNVGYASWTQYAWRGNLAGATNRFSTADDFRYDGYAIGIQTNDLANLDYDRIAVGDQIVSIYPPAAVTVSDGTAFGPDAPITNADSTISTEWDVPDSVYFSGVNVGGRFWGDTLEYRVHLGSAIQGEPPEGLWRFVTGGTDVAVVDYAVSSPFGPDGATIVPVPSLRLVTEPDGLITQIDLRWFLYDGTNYTEMTSAFVRDNYISDVRLVLEDHDGTTANGETTRIYHGIDDPEASTLLTEEWYVRDVHTQDAPEVDYLHLDYSIYATRMFFALN